MRVLTHRARVRPRIRIGTVAITVDKKEYGSFRLKKIASRHGTSFVVTSPFRVAPQELEKLFDAVSN